MTFDDRAWLDASLSDASRAFADFYDRHVQSVYRYSLQIVHGIDDAQDITQEVFVLAWTKRSRIRMVDSSLLPWLLVTSRNLSLNRVKQLRRDSLRAASQAKVDDARAPRSTTDDVAARMLRAAIDAAVEDLSTTDQTLYHLCISEGMSYQQAAAALGATHGAVRNRLGRIRQSLRTTLAPTREGLS